MTQLVINLTRFAQFPTVVNTEGKVSSIRLAPRGRVNTPPDFTVDPNWMGRNPNTVKVGPSSVVASPAPQPEVVVDLVDEPDATPTDVSKE